MNRQEMEEYLNRDGEKLTPEKIKEMKYHYKRSKRAWKKYNRSKPLTLIIIFLIAAVIASAIYLAIDSQNDTGKNDDQQRIMITTAEVTRDDLVRTYKTNGDVQPSSSVNVYPDTQTGKISRVNVELGDKVKKGDTILWIDPSKPGQNYAESPVKAPVDGTVTVIESTKGVFVTAQTPIATIGDLSSLEVIAHIPEKFLNSVKLNQKAEISLISWEDSTIEGKVTEMSPVVDPVSRTLKTIISITGKDKRIKAGMFVRISMITDIYNDILVLPAEAVLERFDEQFVYVVNDGRVEKREIRSTLTIEGKSGIESGLKEGDIVAVKGNNLLEDETRVNIKGN